MRARFRAIILAFISSALLLIQAAAAGVPPRPLSRLQILGLLGGGVSNERIGALVKERGIDFQPTSKYLREVRQAGADRMLLVTLRAAAHQSVVRSAAGSREVSPQIVDHNEVAESCLSAGALLLRRRHYRAAERTYRAGLRAAPGDPNLRFALAHAL